MDIWTFACWNCYRSFPWLNGIEKQYKDQPFKVIGIHSPEFDYEKSRKAVIEKSQEFNLHHAIMMDNNFAFWTALNNQYWPTFYLIDKQGMVRYRFIGETHKNKKNLMPLKRLSIVYWLNKLKMNRLQPAHSLSIPYLLSKNYYDQVN